MALSLTLAEALVKARFDMRQLDRELARLPGRLRKIPDVVVKVRLDTTGIQAALKRVQMTGGTVPVGMRAAGGGTSGGGMAGGGGPRVGQNVFVPVGGSPRTTRGGMLSQVSRAGLAAARDFAHGPVPLAMGGLAAFAGARSAMNTESASARMRMVSGMSAEETSALQSGLFAAAQRIPASMQTFNAGAEIGARAGLTDRRQIDAFSTGLAKISVAMGGRVDMEKVGGELLRVMTLFDLSADKIENVGSALVAMDNAANIQTPELFEFIQRLAPTGKQLGLSLPQVAALGTTMAESGINPEMGGSAMSRLLMGIAQDPGKMAKAAGVSEQEMTAAFRRSPIEALSMTLGGLNQAAAGGNIEAVQFAKDTMGLENIRDVQTFLAMSGRMGRVNDLSQMGGREMQSRQALESAVAIQGATTAAKLTMLNNALQEAAAALGSAFLPMIRNAAGALTALVNLPIFKGVGDAFNAANAFSTGAPFYIGPNGIERGPSGRQANVTERRRTPEMQEIEAAKRAEEYRAAKAAQEAENVARQEVANQNNARLREQMAAMAGSGAARGIGWLGGLMGRAMNAPGTAIPALFRAATAGGGGAAERRLSTMLSTESLGSATALEALNSDDAMKVQKDQLDKLGEIAEGVKDMAKNVIGGGLALIGAE